ncbi:MAG: M60 family metallopeptidase, partial [Lachnospiraceae bacterium]|nr:M60 family metallopeptidase [Lachnospiraceae bacterium]
MKNMFLKCFMLAAGLILIPSLGARANEGQGSYWSETSAPVIYGTTAISIPQGTDFELEDTRFRVFARDFEDGDISDDIVSEHNVNPEVAGSYEITYTVADAHNNTTVVKVPVTVTEDGESVEVTRTLFTTPSVWNMDQAGTNRANYHDSQHLGIYVPKDATVDIKIKNSDRNLDLKFYGNDGNEESGFTIKNDGNWQTFSNVNKNGTFDSVPFIMTPVMKQGVDLNTVFEVELRYNVNSVDELNYYHQGDDETAFKNEWREEQNTYAVFENDVVTVVMPIIDIDLLTNYHEKGFETLDQFGEYWQKVVTRMDELIGLEMDPDNPVHQDVPTRFLVKANRHGAGAAYYAGTHVGINSEHIHPFFEMNWGGLHEFAHGYQGTLGKGVMNLGEVSNNIIGRYIQLDKEIYFHPGDWLGKYSEKENDFNRNRLAGKGWEDNFVDVKLYVVSNLFDAFEGGKTYAKMFRWYREKLAAGVNMTNTDAYVGAIADIYNVNIIPYMEAWGLSVGDEVRQSVNSRKLPLVNILGDMVSGDNLTAAMAALNTNEKYKVVRNDALSSFTGNLTVEMQVEDFTAIQGKELKFYEGSTLVASTVVNSNTVQVSLPVGSYRVVAPVHASASSDAEYVY